MAFQAKMTKKGTLECVVLSPIDYELLDRLHHGSGENLRMLIANPISLDKRLARNVARYLYWDTCPGVCIFSSTVFFTLGVGFLFLWPFLGLGLNLDLVRSTLINEVLATGLGASDFTVMDCSEDDSISSHNWKVFITVQNTVQTINPVKMAQLEEIKKGERAAQRKAQQMYGHMAGADAHGYYGTGTVYAKMGNAQVAKAGVLYDQRKDLERSIESDMYGDVIQPFDPMKEILGYPVVEELDSTHEAESETDPEDDDDDVSIPDSFVSPTSASVEVHQDAQDAVAFSMPSKPAAEEPISAEEPTPATEDEQAIQKTKTTSYKPDGTIIEKTEKIKKDGTKIIEIRTLKKGRH